MVLLAQIHDAADAQGAQRLVIEGEGTVELVGAERNVGKDAGIAGHDHASCQDKMRSGRS